MQITLDILQVSPHQTHTLFPDKISRKKLIRFHVEHHPRWKPIRIRSCPNSGKRKRCNKVKLKPMLARAGRVFSSSSSPFFPFMARRTPPCFKKGSPATANLYKDPK